MTISRVLGVVSFAVVVVALVSVASSWSDDPAADAVAAVATTESVPATLPEPGSAVAQVLADDSETTAPPATTTTTEVAEGAIGVPANDDDSSPVSASTPSPPTTSSESTAPASTSPESTAPPASVSSRSTAGLQAELIFTGEVVPSGGVGDLARYYAGRARASGHVFGPMFDWVAEEIGAADVAICHFGGTLGTGTVTARPAAAPESFATALAETGYDGCSLASDRSLDRGPEGVEATLAAFESAGLASAGIAASDATVAPARYDAAGIAVAHLSYTDQLAAEPVEGEPWWVDVIDAERIIADAAAARAEGSDFVVVSVHWGAELADSPDDAQVELAAALAESGAVDLLVGHGSNIIQPVDVIDDMWVVYGLGNFLSNMSPNCCGVEAEHGVVLHVDIGDVDGVVRVLGASFTPTWVNRVQMQVWPVVDRMAEGGLQPWQRALLRGSWDRTAEVFASLGVDQSLLQPIGERP